MPHKELLDPQGKTLKKNMGNLNIDGVADIRVGKHIEMKFEADDLNAAEEKVESACKKLLANLIMESYHYDIQLID